MKQITPVNKFAKSLSWLVAAILVLVPFHAFITVWLSSLAGHYTLLRLWKEFLLAIITAGSLYILFKNKPLRRKLLAWWPVIIILTYIFLLVICALAARAAGQVSGKAMWYGLLVDLRFLVFFLAVLVIAASSEWLQNRWQKILLIPAVLVAVFAILQFLALPYDFLRHFGYSDSTISPYETINHNLQHIRVASTLRGANPLGAYLILPIAVLTVVLIRDKRQRFNIGILGAGMLMALAFSFSRSAWIGAASAITIAIWLSLKSDRVKSKLSWLGLGLVILLVVLGIALRNNLTVENYLFHTDKVSKIDTSSNEGHSAAFKAAARDIIHHPLGSGVGTAGPQSVYNNHPARIAENYYMQIGQEAGLVGMVLFITICVLVARSLYLLKSDPLTIGLFASLIGLSIVNLLSHAWADDTLAYVWWGFAAIALAPKFLAKQNT
jgi:hypothetical protein